MHGAQGARGSFRIEPFRLKVATDPGFPERTWKVLDGAIDEIFRHNSSRLSFEELYRAAYNMVLHKCGAELYANVERKIQAHLEASAKKIIEQVRQDSGMHCVRLTAPQIGRRRSASGVAARNLPILRFSPRQCL